MKHFLGNRYNALFIGIDGTLRTQKCPINKGVKL